MGQFHSDTLLQGILRIDTCAILPGSPGILHCLFGHVYSCRPADWPDRLKTRHYDRIMADVSRDAHICPRCLHKSLFYFLTGLFTIGTGLSILQTVANPYVTILGPIESAARRISIMGLCNKIAGILAPLLFAAVILKSTDNELFEVLKSNSVTGIEKDILLDGLIRRVIVPYSVLSLFLFLFGCTIYFIRLPELGNNQQEDTIHDNKDRKSIGSYPYLIMGVFAIFFHVAAQVISIDTIISYAENMGFNLQEAKIFPSITLSCALVGYF